MFTSERTELRKMMFNAWQKHLAKEPMEALELQIVGVILLHPEYQGFFSSHNKFEDKDFHENNPFLHIALHLSIREQINTNRPAGITSIYNQLMRESDEHLAEHKMMECLGSFLWEAQKSGRAPNENEYLETLKKLY